MDDLHERDLSQIPDEDLSPAERRELRRRFDELLAKVRDFYAGPARGGGRARKRKAGDQRPAEPADETPPRETRRWDPAADRRRPAIR